MRPWRCAPAQAALLLLATALAACAGQALPGPARPAAPTAAAPRAAPPASAAPAASDPDIPPLVIPHNLPIRFGHSRDDFARSRALIEAIPDGGFYFRASKYGAVRHLPSGMLCQVYEDRRAMSLQQLVLYPGAPPGDDAGCAYVTAGGTLTLRARRAGPTRLSQVHAAMIAAIAREHPDGRPLMGKEASTDPVVTHSFIFAGNREMATIWLAQEGEWILSAEATYPTDARSSAVLQAAMAFAFAQIGARVGCGPGARWLEGTECPG